MSAPRRLVSRIDCALRRRQGSALSCDGKRGLWSLPNRAKGRLHPPGLTAKAPSNPSRTTAENPFARGQTVNYPY